MSHESAILFETSADLLAAVEYSRVTGSIASHRRTNLFYLVQKGRFTANARAMNKILLQFLNVLPLDQSTLEQALNMDDPDFEDLFK